MIFLKNDPRPCATLKQVFLDRFELVVARPLDLETDATIPGKTRLW